MVRLLHSVQVCRKQGSCLIFLFSAQWCWWYFALLPFLSLSLFPFCNTFMSFPTTLTAVYSVSSFSFLTISLHDCLISVCASDCMLLHVIFSTLHFTSFLHTLLVAHQHLNFLDLFSGHAGVRFASHTLLIHLVRANIFMPRLIDGACM
jgi:hypothetical protein